MESALTRARDIVEALLHDDGSEVADGARNPQESDEGQTHTAAQHLEVVEGLVTELGETLGEMDGIHRRGQTGPSGQLPIGEDGCVQESPGHEPPTRKEPPTRDEPPAKGDSPVLDEPLPLAGIEAGIETVPKLGLEGCEQGQSGSLEDTVFVEQQPLPAIELAEPEQSAVAAASTADALREDSEPTSGEGSLAHPSSWPAETELRGEREPHQTLSESVAAKLGILNTLLQQPDPCFDPELDATAPVGHGCRVVDEQLGLRSGESLVVLEDLANLGLLQRELTNRVHLCPECQHCQINFREQCPSCDSIDLAVESLIHHFRCGYMGLESEYSEGFALICPKCRKELFQLGQDFDRPHETYVCGACQFLCEEPSLNGQCLHCTAIFHASRALEERIFRYRPTPLTMRAVELQRLTGLDVDSILYDAQLQIATKDFLDFEVKRELMRLGRYSTPFCTCILYLERDGQVFPVFRKWTADAIRELCTLLARSLRTLDLVTRLDSGRLGILMPESTEEGVAAVRKRLFTLFHDLSFTDRAGRELKPALLAATWTAREATFQEVQAFFEGGPVDESAETP